MTPEAKARLLARLTRDALRAEKISERAKARPDLMVESLAPAARHATRDYPDAPGWRQKLDGSMRALSYSHTLCDWVETPALIHGPECKPVRRAWRPTRPVLTFPQGPRVSSRAPTSRRFSRT